MGVGEPVKLRMRSEAILVKWDGDPPSDNWNVDPIGHPKALEVLKLTEDAPPEVLWRRESNGTDDSGRD